MSLIFNPLLFSGFQFLSAGSGGTSNFKSPVATASALPTVGNNDGDVRVTLDTDKIWVWNNGTSRWVDTGITAAAVGSTPNADGYSIVLDNSVAHLTTRDLVLQPADITNPGILSPAATPQTIGGDKTLPGTITLSSLTVSQPLHLDGSKNIVTAPISLTADVSGVLPIANGGTNSSTALNNNRIIISSSGSLVEQSALTGNQALITDPSGLPITSVTTATELSYVNGVTSAIQTQLNAKEDTANKGAANGYCPLDASTKIPLIYLPSVVMEYQGSWNPTTNTPALSDGTGTNGYVYYVTALYAGPISGLTDPSMVNFQIGDLVIYSTSIGKWQLVTPAAGVSYVNGSQGSVTVNAINQLTGDVTAGPASQSQSVVATIASGAITAGKLGTITDGITLDQAGAGSTLEIKSGGITDTQVSATAAIARTKLANTAAYAWQTNNTSGTLQDTSVTANRAVATDSNGLPVASSTTATELGYVNGVTSSIQTQLNNLSNYNVPGDITQTAFTILNNQSVAADVTGLDFSNASVRSAEIQYSITISATSSLYEEGRLMIVQNGSGWNWSQISNFDNTNVVLSVTNAGQVQYTSTSYTGYTSGKMQFRAWATSV